MYCHFLLLCMLVIQCLARAADFRKDVTRYSCQCSDVINLVCGTDGKTYTNFCQLECVAFHTPGLTLLKKGYCMKDDTCYCPLLWEPACGSDGVTYPSLCDLNCAAKFNSNLRVIHNGKCTAKSFAMEYSEDKEANVTAPLIGLPCSDYADRKGRCRAAMCPFERKDPLCGNNGVTYQNPCFFCCSYEKNPDFKIVRKGKCTISRDENLQSGDKRRNERQQPFLGLSI